MLTVLIPIEKVAIRGLESRKDVWVAFSLCFAIIAESESLYFTKKYDTANKHQ